MSEEEPLGSFIERLQNSPHKRQSIKQVIHEGNRDYVIITASKGNQEDEAHNKELEEEIRRRGLKPIKVEGQYRDESGQVYKEPSYFVERMHYTEARELGEKYNQESILSRNTLQYTGGEKKGYIKMFDPAKTIFGGQASRQTYHSEIGNKKKKTKFSAQGEVDVPYRLF